jgi:hypothetical protein
MRDIVPAIAMACIIILPLIFMEKKLQTETFRLVFRVVSITIIWYLTYAPIHEISHILGFKLTGVEIIEHKLFPHFWKGDFHHAYIIHGDANQTQKLIGRMAPYAKDLIFALAGFFILRKLSVKKTFVTLLVFTWFVSSGLFDLITNFFGFAAEKTGDFYQTANDIGIGTTYFIAISMIVVTGALFFASLKLLLQKINLNQN